MKIFFLISCTLSFILILSVAPVLGCAACYGNLQVYPEQYDQNLSDSIMICGIAAIAALTSVGGASVVEMHMRNRKALLFSKLQNLNKAAIEDSLKFVFADNEIQEISVEEGKIEIHAQYNGDGTFTDKESCYYDILWKLSGTLFTLCGNENISSISLSMKIAGNDGHFEEASSITADRNAFSNCYKNLRQLAMIDPYNAMFNRCNTYYVSEILKPSPRL